MIIKLENITKSYQNNSSELIREVLKGVNFEVSAGSSIAIVGPSGSGKSTMLNIMGTIDSATTGNVYFQQSNITDLNKNQLAKIRNKHIGFVFQQHHLLPQLSLLENVLVPLMVEKNKDVKEKALPRAMELLSKVGLADKIKQLPGQLSVGECQRTAVVRALINQPDLLLADEPTGSLDEDAAINLVQLLCELNQEQNIAVVMVTHSMELAGKMRQLYQLSKGKLVSIKSKI